jgi:glutamate dehydrogenase (NAD(P)+)
VQDLNRDHWQLSVVNEKLRVIMERAFDEVVEMAAREGVNNRLAAYLLAVDRVASATALRGLYP